MLNAPYNLGAFFTYMPHLSALSPIYLLVLSQHVQAAIHTQGETQGETHGQTHGQDRHTDGHTILILQKPVTLIMTKVTESEIVSFVNLVIR